MSNYVDRSLERLSFEQVSAQLFAEVGTSEPRLRAIDDERASEPRAPGKWSRKQILGHLVDSAANNHQRFVRGALDGAVRLPGYEQVRWVELQGWEGRDWEDVVELWSAWNRHLAHLLARIPASREEAECGIGDAPALSLVHVARDYLGHLRHHLAQIFEGA